MRPCQILCTPRILGTQRCPLGPFKGLGLGILRPPLGPLRARARALLRAPLGLLKGLGPGPLKSPPGPQWATLDPQGPPGPL